MSEVFQHKTMPATSTTSVLPSCPLVSKQHSVGMQLIILNHNYYYYYLQAGVHKEEENEVDLYLPGRKGLED